MDSLSLSYWSVQGEYSWKLPYPILSANQSKNVHVLFFSLQNTLNIYNFSRTLLYACEQIVPDTP